MRVQQLEKWGDTLLTLVVPRVDAAAEPCECSGTGSWSVRCYCNCGAGWLGTVVRRNCHCNGCRAVCDSRCEDSWSFCTC
jgi:hypothetical protein